MSGPGPGPGPGDRYYRPVNGYPNSIYAQPSTIPARRPVGGPAAGPVDPAPVSPENSYPPRTTRSVSSSARSRMLQRMGTINSGGKFTVSPASSIHEDDDEEAYGYRGPAGLSPSPPRHYRDGAPTHGTAGWDGQGQGQSQGGEGGQAGLWHGQVPSHVQAQGVPHTTTTATGPIDDRSRAAGVLGVAPALWQTSPDETEIPYPAPPHWRGSRDMQELNEARAREAESGRRPIRTSYGPAPARTSAPLSAAPATISDAPPSLPVPAALIPGRRIANTYTEITPAMAPTSAPTPWQQQPQTQQQIHQQQQTPTHLTPHSNTHQPPTITTTTRTTPSAAPTSGGGAAPFMHYEDIDYFPVAESEPKDESQIDVGVPHADTFPPLPPTGGVNRPRARRSWDRQRRRRRKGNNNGEGTGRRRGEDGGKGGCGGFLGCCARWLPEMAGCLLGVVCLVVIVVVLKAFDGRGLTDWPLTVSLNTVVAFLTAICQVGLAVPLTEGLSQLKWNSFARSEKPLADFQTFENARRGPVSSAVLLYKRKGRALGMSAAVALMTGFLLSPLTQGAITYPTRNFEAGSGTAAIPKSESYSHPTPYESLDTREKQAIQSGIYHAVDVEVPHLPPLCSSGNCQWQNFSSLAVCGAVADITDRLTISNQSRPRNQGVSLGDANDELVRAARLPNGLYLVGSTASCNLNISWPHDSVNTDGDTEEVTDQRGFLPARTSLAFSDQDGRVSSAIANFFLVYTNQTSNTGSGSSRTAFRAAEVLLHFCVNTYEASTSRGVATSRVVHSSTLAAEDASGNSIVNVRHVSSSAPRVFLRSTNTDGVYSVKREDVRFLNGYILSLFSGVYSHWYGKSIGGETATSEALGLAMFQREPSDDDGMRSVVGNLTANVATSLTNMQVDFLRMRAMSSASASGTVFATESYVHIQWAWLTFLAIQVALSVSFLLGIMIQTAVWNVKILKGSSTAALLAIPADEKAYLEERENMFLDNDERAETSRKLQTITCRFRPGERGWSLEADKREEG